MWTHRTWHVNDLSWGSNYLGTSLRARLEFVVWFAMLLTFSMYSLLCGFRLETSRGSCKLRRKLFIIYATLLEHDFMSISPAWHAFLYDSISIIMCLMCTFDVCLFVCFAYAISWGSNQHGTHLLSRLNRARFKRSPCMGALAWKAPKYEDVSCFIGLGNICSRHILYLCMELYFGLWVLKVTLSRCNLEVCLQHIFESSLGCGSAVVQ